MAMIVWSCAPDGPTTNLVLFTPITVGGRERSDMPIGPSHSSKDNMLSNGMYFHRHEYHRLFMDLNDDKTCSN